MKFNYIDFTKLAATLEPYGDNFILRLAVIPGVSDVEYLSRAVTTLYNFGAIDFIPEAGVKEYSNLVPFNAGVDEYAMLQTSASRLRTALEAFGAMQAYGEFWPLLDKRDTTKPRVKINPRETDLFPEIAKHTARAESAFLVTESAGFHPSMGTADYVLGSF